MPYSEEINFQLLDWNSYHEIDDYDEEVYIIQLFGRTIDDNDVCLKVTGFMPFFYVEIPIKWGENEVQTFIKALKNKVSWCIIDNTDYDFDISKSLICYKIVKKHKFYNFTNKESFKFVELFFKSLTGMRFFSNILSKPLKIPNLSKANIYSKYESNIEPHIRFMHINNLVPCGWVSFKLSEAIINHKYSNCHYSYSINYKYVLPSNIKDVIAPYKIMGYDIECISCDYGMPQAHRESDKIIQIGITMYRYGSMNCYEQYMLALNTCANIKNVIVKCYKTEKKLIRGWAKMISKIRPDFKAGYNNFGFDDKYIFERINRIDQETAKKKNISVEKLDDKFIDEILCIIGKVNNEYIINNEGIKQSLTYFKICKLSSSALGDNNLNFFQVPGIVSIDMMKVIQRDHRLISYKLDNVSANFITEKVIKIIFGEIHNGKINADIYTNSTKALEKKSYIQIMVNDSYSSSPLNEGTKYKVHDIITVTECINKEEKITFQVIKTDITEKEANDLKNILANPVFKVFWTFAKDDMHHTLINKYFKENDKNKIALVAKYCIKDCKLVNLLLAKLEIIVNSISMANVCNVPLSYLFLRGQGVKIFSLVSKKCREKNFLMPVIKKKSDTENSESYEGATVITPIPAIYLSPIGVLDFSSLYPNSMREKNLSPECYVNDKKYDNLPGYIYHDIYIDVKNNKGEIVRNFDGLPVKVHHRFSQKIMSDKDISIELADIIKNITLEMENNIKNIQNQQYITGFFRNYKITTITSQVEKILVEELEHSDILEKLKKNIQLETIIDKINASHISEKKKKKIIKHIDNIITEKILKIVNHEKKILQYKQDIEKKIQNINSNDNLSDEKKKERITKLNNLLEDYINHINTKLLLSNIDKEELVELEKKNANDKISVEKMKKYNTVNNNIVSYGILPEILTELINKRKETNVQLSKEKDVFVKSILNSLQLAFKVVANSIYGQTGAPTSPIFFMPIAASTTAIGRERLYFAKNIVEKTFPKSEIIYGDTDSIFINFHIKNKNGEEIFDEDALVNTITLCQQAAKAINSSVPKPQSIVYEKTLHPFILIAKKKYVGLLFEKDPHKYVMKSMGIVLKRRDNAPIVKIIIGGIIDYILKNRDIDKAITYIKDIIGKLMDGYYPIDKFIISKTLRAQYKNPMQIAHKVLADRMATRDPGNKPHVNDRIPFVYVLQKNIKKKKNILQGDLIEHPDFVIQNNLKIDYLYYLEHQIINPATQILELALPTEEVKLIFEKFIIYEENKRIGRQNLAKWYHVEKKNGSKTEIKKNIKKNIPLKQIKYNKNIKSQNLYRWYNPK